MPGDIQKKAPASGKNREVVLPPKVLEDTLHLYALRGSGESRLHHAPAGCAPSFMAFEYHTESDVRGMIGALDVAGLTSPLFCNGCFDPKRVCKPRHSQSHVFKLRTCHCTKSCIILFSLF